MAFEDYDGGGLPLRSCSKSREPHRAHPWKHPVVGDAHCWGRNELPADAVEKYCTKGCNCEHCSDIRKGLHPRTIMCVKTWEALPHQEQLLIHESVSD